MKIKKALLSVSDKRGIVELAQFLVEKDVQLLSTGGTARAIKESGLEVTEISDYTEFPEMMDGRVKTLHPKVHGGLLHLRDNSNHVSQAQEHGIEAIDLVVVNLYPFEETIRQPDCSLQNAIENIDIGGPSMLRSAAKNHASVTVVVDPDDYKTIIDELETHGDTSIHTRNKLAAKVYRHTAYYDALISSYLTSRYETDNPTLHETGGILKRRAQPLRYGENPFQKAALYGEFLDYFRQLHGKELSYNNIIDISAAVGLMHEFDNEKSTLAILKHTNPCGVGTADCLKKAWELAYSTDNQAPFGGIIIMNKAADKEVAESIAEIFSEVIIAPSFTDEALEILHKKKNLRLIENHFHGEKNRYDMKSVLGGLLIQESDDLPDDPASWEIVSKRKPTQAEMDSLKFGWRIVKHVKSNAIVYSNHEQTLGIGAGQMSRVDSSRIAVWKANEAKLSLKGSSIASDAFFPFPDGIEAAAEAGATAAIQPGGSVRDEQVIAAADKADMAMVFTGKRHFRH
ncbi:MAG: bifunctional phosphoribosylaminoimidazolecarboxamide formyltransferase/IMP cyclohydrolase [Verrucomicrobiota bacterium]